MKIRLGALGGEEGALVMHFMGSFGGKGMVKSWWWGEGVDIVLFVVVDVNRDGELGRVDSGRVSDESLNCGVGSQHAGLYKEYSRH